jgi:hypothetical protein
MLYNYLTGSIASSKRGSSRKMSQHSPANQGFSVRFATMQMNAVELSSQSAIDGDHKILIITDKCVLYATGTVFIVCLEHDFISLFSASYFYV